MLTAEHIYKVIYSVVLNDNSHLGHTKADLIANTYAVKATWRVTNNPREYLRFAAVLLRQTLKE
jgi:hypothetical protein